VDPIPISAREATTLTTPRTADRPPTHHLTGLAFLFVGSGAAALIYEIVWFQMLQLVIGATGVSLGLLLGTFMGGMFIGSLLLPRIWPPGWSPLHVYAALEVAIGIWGLVVLLLLPGVNGVYASVTPPGVSDMLVRAALCALVLLPPTILMGATLPAISRHVETTREGVSWMGLFYTGNIAGAVFGSLAAGFYLLRVHDVVIATGAAMALNAIVATSALILAKRTSEWSPSAPPPEEDARHAPAPTGLARATLYVALGLSGLAALGSEVVWTRLLSLLLGSTTYTFSIILAVFLAGLAGGSSIGSRLARTTPDPRRAFLVCQLLSVVAIGYSAWMVSGVLTEIAIPVAWWTDPWRMLGVDLARCVVAILPAPICWGASFPLAVAAAAGPGQDPARLIGGLYAANTAGAIVGALGGGLVLVPLLGTHGAQQALVIVAALAAVTLIVEGEGAYGTIRARAPALASALIVAGGTVALLPPTSEQLIVQGRHVTYGEDVGEVLFVGEGLNASVAVTQEVEEGDTVRTFRISGKVAASTWPEDMVLQRMLGHLSGLFHEDPKTVLVVGFGAGVTAGTFVMHPGIERIVICEIEALATEATADFFREANHAILDDPRVEVIHDDARHFLLTTDETFDVITSDPIHPWVKGAAALYTTEYFELAREHLNPGGVITQWVPLYESTLPVVRSELATFIDVFPDATVWSSQNVSNGFDIVMAARPDGFLFDLYGMEDRLARPDHAGALASMSEIGLTSAEEVLRSYAGRGPELAPWLADAMINSDRTLRLMYMAGLGLNANLAGDIHAEIFRHRTFPADLILADPARLERLRNETIGEIR